MPWWRARSQQPTWASGLPAGPARARALSKSNLKSGWHMSIYLGRAVLPCLRRYRPVRHVTGKSRNPAAGAAASRRALEEATDG